MTPNPRYIKGRSKEYQTMRTLESAGYTCARSAGSHGFFDVFAFNSAGFRLIQVKSDCSPTALEREFLKEFKDIPGNCSKELWTYHAGSSIATIEKF